MPEFAIDHRKIVECREMLRAAREGLRIASIDHPIEGYHVGLVTAVIEDAADALFAVLNHLDSYLGDEEAGRVVHLREWKEPAASLWGHTPASDAASWATFKRGLETLSE